MDLDLELSVSVYDVNMRIVVPFFFSTNQDFMEFSQVVLNTKLVLQAKVSLSGLR